MFRPHTQAPDSPDLIPIQAPVSWEPDANWMTALPSTAYPQFHTPPPNHDYERVQLPSTPFPKSHMGSPLANKSRIVKSSRSMGNIGHERSTPERYIRRDAPPVPTFYPQASYALLPHPHSSSSQHFYAPTPPLLPSQRRLTRDEERKLDEEQKRLAKDYMRAGLKQELKRQEEQDKAAKKAAKVALEQEKERKKRRGMVAPGSGDHVVRPRDLIGYNPKPREAAPKQVQSRYYEAAPAPQVQQVVMPQFSAYPPNESTPPPGVLGLRKTKSSYQKPINSVYHPEPPYGRPF